MQAWDEEMRDAVSSKQWGTVLVVVDIGVTKVGKACSVDTRYQVWKVADPAEPAGRWMNLVVYGFVLGPQLTFKDIRVGDVFTITGASVNCKSAKYPKRSIFFTYPAVMTLLGGGSVFWKTLKGRR